MIQKTKSILITLAMAVGLVALPATTVSAVNVFDACTTDSTSAVCKSKGDDANQMVKTVINTLLFILGAIAVIMIVIGGLKYVTSNGEQSNVTSAKNTILYSVIGLVVAMLAWSIVNFVVDAFNTPAKETQSANTKNN